MERNELYKVFEAASDQTVKPPDLNDFTAYSVESRESVDAYVEYQLPIMKAELIRLAAEATERHEQWATISRVANTTTEAIAVHSLCTRLSGWFQEDGFQTEDRYEEVDGSKTIGLTIFWGDDAKTKYLRRASASYAHHVGRQ